MMRGNKNVAIQVTAANPYLFDTSGPPYRAAPEDCYRMACTTTTNVAIFEMGEWLSRVVGTPGAIGVPAVPGELPGARVKVCFDSTPFTAQGIPQWACSDSGAVAVVKIGWTRSSTNRAATGATAIELATTPTIVLPVTPGTGA